MAAFAFPLDRDGLIRRCGDNFDRAMSQLEGKENPVVVLGVEATHVRLEDGATGDDGLVRVVHSMEILKPEIWRMIEGKSQWRACLGCLLVFKLPERLAGHGGQPRPVQRVYHCDWRDPRGGTAASTLPPHC